MPPRQSHAERVLNEVLSLNAQEFATVDTAT